MVDPRGTRPMPERAARRGRGALAALGALGVLLVACGEREAAREGPAPGTANEGAAPQPPPTTLPARVGIPVDQPRQLVTRDGLYRVSWMPQHGFVPVNEHFELDVTVARVGPPEAPVTGARVEVDCQMPDHGHGMLREPRSAEVGEGRYRVRGMLLHMGGHWTMAMTVVVDGLASTADDTLDL